MRGGDRGRKSTPDRPCVAHRRHPCLAARARERCPRGERQIADLVQEQRALLALRTRPGRSSVAPGEGALAMSEEGGLDEVGRKRPAADRDERAAPRHEMHGFVTFLAGAGVVERVTATSLRGDPRQLGERLGEAGHERLGEGASRRAPRHRDRRQWARPPERRRDRGTGCGRAPIGSPSSEDGAASATPFTREPFFDPASSRSSGHARPGSGMRRRHGAIGDADLEPLGARLRICVALRSARLSRTSWIPPGR